MIDDDHVFAPSVLTRLPARLEDSRVDVVVPLILKRVPPFDPVLFQWGEDKRLLQVTAAMIAHARGVLEIDAGPGSGMLIRRRVFERIAPPRFTAGQFVADLTAEDTTFYRKLRDAGCRVFVDLDVQLGHITSAAVWPAHPQAGYRIPWLFAGYKQGAAADAMEHLGLS